MTECERCKGSGYIIVKDWRLERRVCPDCQGRGFETPWVFFKEPYSEVLKLERGRIKRE